MQIHAYKRQILFALLGSLLVAGAALGGYYFFATDRTDAEENHIVYFTPDGFEPKEMTITIGESVTFVSQSEDPFWPASNTHPDHTIYPEFDPKEPIAPGGQWTFTFTQSGVWRYHDHIQANNTGSIVVLDEDNAVKKYGLTLDINECIKHTEYTEKRLCWEGQLEKAMQEGGVMAAFAYFDDLYKTEPDVPKECHGWSHTLGKAGYEYYLEHGTIVLTEGTTHCGYGFYHAYLAELMKNTGNFNDAKVFCETVTVDDESYTSKVRTSCKHGIGHGAAAMLVEDPEYYGDFFKTSEEAVRICDSIYTYGEDLTECYDGIYNELYQDILNTRYGYSFEEYKKMDDPYWHCQKVGERYRGSCYVNVVGILPAIYGEDVIRAMRYLLANTHDLERNGKKIIAKIAADRIQTSIVYDSHADSLEACSLVPDFLYETCFEGILNGFVQHGEPNNLHPKGYAFCSEEAMPKEQQQGCFESFTRHLKLIYTTDQVKNACSYAAEKYGRTIETCESV
jgi:plastocyanin